MSTQGYLEKKSLDEALNDIRGFMQSGDGLSRMSSDILELTEVVDGQEIDSKAEEKKYKVYLNQEKSRFLELEHGQMVLIVTDALKNNLGNWLNKNLPDIVEKEVKKQIELLIHKENLKQG